MGDIALYVCCHKESEIPAHPLLRPIQVGAALAQRRFPGFLSDDSGENISAKNRAYCELTAQYWAWKNSDAEYCGFFHYRRFLYPDAQARRPYLLMPQLTDGMLEKLGYGGFASLIRQYDMILPMPEEMHTTVRAHYAHAPYHHGSDLARMEEILRERAPEYTEAAQTYLSGTAQYFGNIFIMRRSVFDAYCAWLFPLLEEFDRRTDTSGYSPQEARVDGYLAERLLGVYAAAGGGMLKTLALPRVQFEPDAKALTKKRLELALLPAGTRRRAAVKRLLKG